MDRIPPLIWITAAVAVFSMGLYILRQIQVKRDKSRRALYTSNLFNMGKRETFIPRKRDWRILLDTLIQSQQDMISDNDLPELVQEYLDSWDITKYLFRKILHGSRFRICQTAQYLAYLPEGRYNQALIYALEKTEKENIALYIAFALVRHKTKAAIPTIIDSIQGKSDDYRERVIGLLLQYGTDFYDFVPILEERNEKQIQHVIITYADHFPDKSFIKPLLKYMESSETQIRRQAFHCLIRNYYQEIEIKDYLSDEDNMIQRTAIQGLTLIPDKENFRILISLLNINNVKHQAESALTKVITENPSLFLELTHYLDNEQNGEIRKSLIRITSQRMEYFLPQLNNDTSSLSTSIIKEVIKNGQFSSMINFLNRNRDPVIEKKLLHIIRQTIREENLDPTDFQTYLKPEILKKLDWEKKQSHKSPVNEKKEQVRTGPLYIILTFIIMIFTGIVLFSFFLDKQQESLLINLKQSLNLFMIIFGFYCLAANAVYIILLILSFINSRIQSRFQKIKPQEFLFSRDMLPSLSIIAPAYCEQETIIESISSLLNLKYPNYEVIVVNDGSSDNTLSILIETFDLEREDRIIPSYLRTQPIRGIYSNPNIPDLIVVDKVNGGKADSLNAGINVSGKNYFVGIDSDSLLERDALLKLTSMFIDSRERVVASGGNILPINGCSVENGHLEKKHTPRQILPLFQNIEYLRAFMSGRLGWSMLRSLLIISGAFGVFHWRTVVDIHGYLTSKEYYDKDTVGEDMELVVRITRMLREKGSRFRILYSYLANCWTEVPGNFSILKKQRDRWQRGLIDILLFHKNIFFNRKYGNTGFAAFPYFILFEVAGPWLEIAGTILLIAGIISGWITPWIMLFVLCSNILFGLFLSLCSLLIADWDGSQYPVPVPDRLRLLLAAILENFGFRQFMSFFRIVGFINTMKRVTGWGKMSRQGFNKE